ncbi:MAG TPA: hypothetical protein VJ941_07750, partial [Gracilimonas sp.]|nr:hypothetical protein [Gracilimonas sp.]
MRSIYLTAWIILLSAYSTAAMGQIQPPVPAPTDFEVTAVFAENPPYIDGDLSDEVWEDIPPITNLTQVWPNDGAEATEKTEVRIAYDRDHLYFAFRFYDKNPELIRAKNLERGGRNNRD